MSGTAQSLEIIGIDTSPSPRAPAWLSKYACSCECPDRTLPSLKMTPSHVSQADIHPAGPVVSVLICDTQLPRMSWTYY